MSLQKESPVLTKPTSFFTSDFSCYRKITNYSVNNRSPFFWENDSLVVYIRHGSGTLTVNKVPYPIKPGCLAALHSFHVFQFLAEEPLQIEILIFPYPEMTHMAFQRLHDPTEWESIFHRICCISLVAEQREKAESLLDLYQQEVGQNDGPSRMIQSSLISQLNHIHKAASGLYRKDSSMPKEALCSDIFLYISVFCNQNLTPQSVAERFQLSVSQMNTELRRICGCSFWPVLNRARVSYVYSALLQYDVPARVLVKQSGFSSENGLYRAFQEFRGCSPQQLRKQMVGSSGVVCHLIEDKRALIQLYILQNCREPIDIKTCARDLYMTTESINQILQTRGGRDARFQNLLTTIRLRFAEGLLAVSELPICDVMIYSGFNSVHTFIRLFKNKHAMTPTEYRQLFMEVQNE